MGESRKIPSVTLTDTAIEHIQQVIVRRGSGIGFRIAVKENGCVGYMYKLEIVDKIILNDVVIETGKDFLLCIDPDSVNFLRGAEIDYVSKGLGQKQLLFNNPNVESECGCGESFSLKVETQGEK